MAYVLEGLLHAYTFTRSELTLQAALRYAERLKEINVSRDDILYSRYDPEFRRSKRASARPVWLNGPVYASHSMTLWKTRFICILLGRH